MKIINSFIIRTALRREQVRNIYFLFKKRASLFIALLLLSDLTMAQAPVIFSFSPISAPVGSEVIISGSYFSETPAENIVFFGATQATVSAASESSLHVIVPYGATYEPITVTTNDLTAYSALPFSASVCLAGTIDENTLLPKVTFNSDNFPSAFIVSDIDGDGKPDLAVIYLETGFISFYRNTSTPGEITSTSFATKLDIFTALHTDFFPSIATGDLNSDGKPDLILKSYEALFYILLNTSTSGSISFDTVFTVDAPYNNFSVEVSDLNADGRPDIVTSSSYDDQISVYQNIYSGGEMNASSFSDRIDFETGDYPTAFKIRDIDGDNKPDIVVLDDITNNVSVLRNTSELITISFAGKIDFDAGDSGYMTDVAVGDLDADGKPEIAVQKYVPHTISILKNTSVIGEITTSSFAPPVDFKSGSNLFLAGVTNACIKIGDINGDEKPDLISADYANDKIAILQNISVDGIIDTNSFAPKVDFDADTPWWINVADIDGDGKSEVISTNTGSVGAETHHQMFVYRNVCKLIPALCLVSVDSLSMHNNIYWDNTNYIATDSFIIYRETFSDTYERIGAVSSDSPSMFVDTTEHLYFPFTGNPNSGTYRYKLQLRDTCGGYGDLSPYHNTLFATKIDGTFNWNFYAVEDGSSATEITAYYLYRDDESTGEWNVINAVSATQSTMNDPDYSLYPFASWRIEAAGNIICAPAVIDGKTSGEMDDETAAVAFSNIIRTGNTPVDNIHKNNIFLHISPNPAVNTLYVETAEFQTVLQIDIYSIAGEKMSSFTINASDELQLDISGLPNGMYMINISDNEKSCAGKFIRQQ